MTYTDDLAVVREALLHWGVDECCGNDVKAALDRMERAYDDLAGGPSNAEAQAMATRLAEAERVLRAWVAWEDSKEGWDEHATILATARAYLTSQEDAS